MRKHDDLILLYTRESVTIQAWRADGKSGRDLLFSMDNLEVQWQQLDIALRSPPHSQDAALLLRNRSSTPSIRTGQSAEALVCTKEFTLVKVVLNGRAVLGWVSNYYVGGVVGEDLRHLRAGHILSRAGIICTLASSSRGKNTGEGRTFFDMFHVPPAKAKRHDGA